MGNRPASGLRFAKVRADDKNWGSAPHSQRLCEKPAWSGRILHSTDLQQHPGNGWQGKPF
jgi:hypothetical protein